MARRYHLGRPRHWKTRTFIGALRVDRVDAPLVIDGPINGELFALYAEQVLAPTLAKGDIVVLDNLGSHEGKAARSAICQAGARMVFLPPLQPRPQPVYGWLLQVKDVGSVRGNWSVAAIYTASDLQRDRCAP